MNLKFNYRTLLYLFPALLVFIVFNVLPGMTSLVLSFFEFSGFETNLFKLKKIIHKHTDCDLHELNKILEENDITEDSFILNDINEKLIKKVIGLMNKKES